MAKTQTRYVCQKCATVHAKWAGKCDGCGEWNTLSEDTAAAATPGGLKGAAKAGSRKLELVDLSGTSTTAPRRQSGIAEFDRVCGGGLVPGAALLVGGDPGIGKSTLLLQIAAKISKGARALYITGEEAIDQIRMRADRLGLADAPVQLATATSIRDILSTLDGAAGTDEAPDFVVIDSIQTMFVDNIESAPGTVTQVRASAQEMVRYAKRRGVTVVLVGHVTKEGQIAGPRVLEHVVDTVLYFEGERGHQFRILRSVKNRYGPTDEIGVFEMTDSGLMEVQNPSALFLSDRDGSEAVSGACVFAGIEGTRPMLVEIQALVAPSSFAAPRRAVVGWDSARLSMLLAALEARCGVAFAGRDVYLNVAGGLRIAEPAADLAVAAALLSALTDEPLPHDMVVFGEVGLSGEIRAVSQMGTRLKEAQKLGFTRAIVPPLKARKGSGKRAGPAGMDTAELRRLEKLVARFGVEDDANAAKQAAE